MTEDLQRFKNAHERDFQRALTEIQAGRKSTHWMWYIFPQLKGLGLSETAQYYGINSPVEARAFLADPLLGEHIITISKALLLLPTSNATAVFGKPDDKKLHSSMTLFSLLPGTDPVFQKVLEKYFGGHKDVRTVSLLSI